MVQEGDRIENFTLPDADGNNISLDDFKGKKVVVYFYPRDNTPGCTKEACSIRDVYDDILATGTVVLGISADSVTSHSRFREKHQLPFYLLSDPEKSVIQQFGVWGEKKMYGKTSMGLLRSTFILDEDRNVLKVFKKVNTAEHGEEILPLLQSS